MSPHLQIHDILSVACTLIIILLLVQPSLQTTFPTEHYSSCLSRLQSYCNSTTPPITGGNCTDAILNGLLDGNGNRALNVNSATAIRFSLCELECGRSQLPFSWAIFSQQFSAWLLPFLALISQLPFGARHRLDNLTSMFLAVGSPTMAAYSLAITVLNSRWIKHRFDAVRYRNAGLAVKILPNLQYSPVRVHCTTFLLSSLIILRENDGWWSELNQRIHYKRTWSIAAAASIIWVVIAYAFTVILSIGNLKSQVGSNGQSVGTVWLWLIPVVVGWQQLSPKSDHDHLKEIFDHVNGLAYVASPAGVVKASSQGLLRAISIDAFFSNTLFFLDENRSPPIFNYARFLSWSQSAQIICDAFRNASLHASLKASPVAETGREPLIGDMGSMDTYCGISERRAKSRRKWASGIVPRMVMASTVALALQWGTTGASIIGEILSPTTVYFSFIATEMRSEHCNRVWDVVLLVILFMDRFRLLYGCS